MITNKVDLVSSLFLLALGGGVVGIAMTYNIGTATNMGPGYFPMVLGILLLILAIVLGLGSLRTKNSDSIEIAWRPFLAVNGSIAGFIVGLAYGGLLLAVVATVAISAFGDTRSKPVSTIILAIVIIVGVWLVFIQGLRVSIPILGAY